jgi:hypothetical protein
MAEDQDPNLARFRDHPVHDHIGSAHDTLIKVMDVDAAREGPNSTIVHRLARGFEKAQRLLATADQALTGTALLKEILGAASSFNQHLTNWLNEHNNAAHLTAASSILEANLLPAASRLPQVDTPQDVSALFAAVEAGRSNAAKVIEEQRAQFTSLIDALTAQLKAATAEAEAVKREHSRIQEAQAKQDDRINASIARIDQLVGEFNKRAADAERDRDARAAEAIEELRKDIAKRQEDSAREIQEVREAFDRETRTILEALKRDKDEARNLVQAIGEFGVSSPFGNTAAGDRRAALVLRVLAGAFFTGMVGTVVWVTIWSFTHGPVDIDDMIFRFMTALIFAVPAYYFAREASKFQGEADRNRRLQLELASLGPYLENLNEPAKRAAVREKLIERYFVGPGVIEPDKAYSALDVNALVDVLKEAIKKK